MNFIDIVIKEIERIGITCSELARQTNIPISTIKSWERGSQPSLESASKVAKFLDLSLDELYGIKYANNKIKDLYNAYKYADPITQANIRKLLDLPEPKALVKEEKKRYSSKIGEKNR